MYKPYITLIKKLLPNVKITFDRFHIKYKKSNETIQYYHVVNDDGKIVERYIPKENINFIRSLAQKSYNKNLKRFINKRIKILNKLKDFKHD
ncbi:transposase [Helcococcus ovis]|uniref:transposase n=1 Tax=Helcococcus ovis TaxID=72026 RepID=UPI0038BBAE78